MLLNALQLRHKSGERRGSGGEELGGEGVAVVVGGDQLRVHRGFDGLFGPDVRAAGSGGAARAAAADVSKDRRDKGRVRVSWESAMIQAPYKLGCGQAGWGAPTLRPAAVCFVTLAF